MVSGLQPYVLSTLVDHSYFQFVIHTHPRTPMTLQLPFKAILNTTEGGGAVETNSVGVSIISGVTEVSALAYDWTLRGTL